MAKRRAVDPPDDQPPSKRQNLDIPQSFEYVEDIFDDDMHRRMDKQVLEVMGPLLPPEKRARAAAATLLQTIVHVSDGRLKSKYDNIRETEALIKEHPKLIDFLKEAWCYESFKKIRNLKILNVPRLSRAEQRFNAVQNFAITNAWKEEYRGNYHEILYANLNRMDHSNPYSNTVSIIQSSGSGKSRLVDNMAHLVFTIPFNIRPFEDSQVFAFPPPDDQIRTLLSQPAIESIDGLHAYYLRFLQHVFKEIRKVLKQSFCESESSYAALATSWRCHLASDGARQSLYDSVVQAFKRSWRKVVSEKDIILEDFATETRKAFDRLSTAIDRRINPTQLFNEKIKIVMYFDECHSLSTPSAPSNKYDKKLLDVLFAAIDSLSDRPLMAIFLSTMSHISSLAPSASYARSARARQCWNGLQAPITETPFDCGPGLPLTPNTLRLRDTCTVEFMAQFGRPLFWTMIKGAGDRKDSALSIVIDLARSKLLCQNDINVGHRDVTAKHALSAVVDLRLMFDYELGRESTRAFEAELVSSHMRMVFSVPQTWEYLRSGYPSEPLMAEAAAQQMGFFRSKDPDFTVDTLMKNLDLSFVDKRQCGELVTRELLTSAYDRAIEREFKSSAPGSSRDQKEMLLYSKGVSVITFIEELFASPFAEAILDCIPHNVEDPTPFRKAFQKAKVRFTHFGKMADKSGTTSDAVWVAFIRGMAIIATMGTCSIGLIIPVLLQEDAIICEEAVTSILISVKTQKAKYNIVKYEVDEKAIEFFPRSESIAASQRPFISLVMELGMQSSSSVNASKPVKGERKKRALGTSRSTCLQRQQTPSMVTIPEQGRCYHSSSKHPRYSIFVYGCSNTVYKGITPTQREKYRFLLASRDFLAEHPRQDIEVLSALRQMKPFWKAGDDFYNWIGDIPSRLKHEEVEPTHEGVITVS